MNRLTNRPTRSAISPSAPRGGVTLVEVLMSLLVVGIGLVSVAVLFPLSILRTIEATQLTSATMMRYNAEQMIEAFPEFLFDPDGNANWNEHAGTNYIIDPLGEVALTSLPGDAFGMPSGPAVPFAGIPALPRFRGGRYEAPPFAAAPQVLPGINAANFVTLPDSWDTLLDQEDALPNTLDNTVATGPSIILPGAFAATGLTANYASGAGQPVYRAIFFDVTGDVSHTRVLTGIDSATDTLTWDNPLPRIDTDSDGIVDADFTPATAWLQVQEQHYSWMLTVRRQIGNVVAVGPPFFISDEAAEVDVVVFFNRAPGNEGPLSVPPSVNDPLAENAYPLLEPGFKIGVPSVSIDWGTNSEPFLKEGTFIFDPENARWYRILKITSLGDTRARLDLDRGAESDSTFSDNAGELGLGVFMKGIVDVYPIKSKTARFEVPVP